MIGLREGRAILKPSAPPKPLADPLLKSLIDELILSTREFLNVSHITSGRSKKPRQSVVTHSGVKSSAGTGKESFTMQYRRFGKLDWKASALGFGCMRFPTTDGQRTGPNINQEEALRMLRHAIDNGVNYIDTAYPYHEGQSEIVVGKALEGGYREKVRLATKLPVWMVKEPADFDRFLNEQLKRLKTDSIDFYLLHSLNQSSWRDIVLKHDLLGQAARALADGRIQHLGFSMHDDYACFEEIVNGSDLWSFCQIQYNYMDTENQAGTRGLRLAAGKGLAVVVMEPLLGGRLADPPQDIREAVERFPVRRSPAEWAFQWLWDQPEVSVVLSGMSAMSQVEENLRFAEASRIQSFSPAEQTLIAEIREKYESRTVIPCTRCGYCMPCPNGVNIPGNFDLFNYAHLFDDVASARFRYEALLTAAQRSVSCIACGLCEEQCPQSIPIAEWMEKVSALLA
jgi:predicted aldo/keto reductase-like oxidoreductase